MSNSLAALRHKIGSAEDLHAVVRTMKALAASQIGQYERALDALADYDRTVELGLSVCLRRLGAARRAWPEEGRLQDGAVGAVVFGSDQGLVGQFNEAVADFAAGFLRAQALPAKVWAVGEFVHARLVDAGVPALGQFAVPGAIQAIATLVGRVLVQAEEELRKGGLREFHLFYNSPSQGAIYGPVRRRLLPLDETWRRDLAQMRWPSRALPEVMGVRLPTLRALMREHLFIRLFRACAESLAAENASRLAAMQRADRNIDELLERLHRRYQSQRQTGIDDELFDVISGFEALPPGTGNGASMEANGGVDRRR